MSRATGLPFSLLLLVSACSASANLNSGRSVDLDAVARQSGPEQLRDSPASSELGNVRLRAQICQGFDLTPDYGRLGVTSVTDLLRKQRIAFDVDRQRSDLVYVNLRDGENTIQLHVAVLRSPEEAARHLHEALLQHGQGYWGVHRSNLAVLGPGDSTANVMAFAARTKLACWGVLTITGRDDTYVVPGGYASL